MKNKIFRYYKNLLPCPLCGSEAHKSIETVEGYGDFQDYDIARIECENQNCRLQMQDADSPWSNNIENRWNYSGEGSLRYENELLSNNLQGAINKLTDRSYIVWRDPKKELPKEIDSAVLVFSEGKILSATYDYYCPIISSNIIPKWVIYREPGKIYYLEGTVDLWAYIPKIGCSSSSAASILGSIKTEKKAKSSAENGKKGGRPRKGV